MPAAWTTSCSFLFKAPPTCAPRLQFISIQVEKSPGWRRSQCQCQRPLSPACRAIIIGARRCPSWIIISCCCAISLLPAFTLRWPRHRGDCVRVRVRARVMQQAATAPATAAHMRLSQMQLRASPPLARTSSDDYHNRRLRLARSAIVAATAVVHHRHHVFKFANFYLSHNNRRRGLHFLSKVVAASCANRVLHGNGLLGCVQSHCSRPQQQCKCIFQFQPREQLHHFHKFFKKKKQS